MRPTVFSTDVLRQFLFKNRIATLPQLKQTMGTEADITIFRKLKELSYRASYSHRGSFYTLDEIANFDERGFWSFDSVQFSRQGTLVATAEVCVTQAGAFDIKPVEALLLDPSDAWTESFPQHCECGEVDLGVAMRVGVVFFQIQVAFVVQESIIEHEGCIAIRASCWRSSKNVFF